MLLRLPRGFHQATNGYTRPLPLRPDCGLPCGNSRRLRRDRTDAWYGAGSRNHRSGRSTAGSAAGHRPKGPACHRGGKIPRLYAGFDLSPGRAARGRCCSLLPPVSPSAEFGPGCGKQKRRLPVKPFRFRPYRRSVRRERFPGTNRCLSGPVRVVYTRESSIR